MTNCKNVPNELSNLKSKSDKLDNGKLETTLVEKVKKVSNVSTTDTSNLVF